MSTKIGGLDGSPVQIGKSGGVKPSSGAPSGVGSSKTEASSDTQITDSARQLATLEQTVRDLPAIDPARVEQVSQRIQNGNYEINSSKIADKLLQLEQELNQDA